MGSVEGPKTINGMINNHLFYSVCHECQQLYEGECSLHGTTRPIADTSTPSEGTQKTLAEDMEVKPTIIMKVLASLPEGMEVKQSNIEDGGLGVFATTSFESGAWFGPYGGEKIKADVPKNGLDTSYMWEVSV